MMLVKLWKLKAGIIAGNYKKNIIELNIFYIYEIYNISNDILWRYD